MATDVATLKQDVAVIKKDTAEIKDLLARRPWFRFEFSSEELAHTKVFKTSKF